MKKFLTAAAFLSVMIAPVYSEDWYQIYFTHPGKNSGTSFYTPEQGLSSAIRRASANICCAFYDLDSSVITSELIKAKKRGVEVKLVTDNDNYSNRQVSDLQRNGIPVVCDSRKPFMHNKFAVIDGKEVWTGSYNVTVNGEKKNDNNALLIKSPELAEIYMAEFSEMFDDGVFGYGTGRFTGPGSRHSVKAGDTEINVYFAPEDPVEKEIIKRIEKAEKSIRFLAFSFTSDNISEAMISRFKEGVSVSGVFENRGILSKDSEYIKMKVENIPVRADSNPNSMHHKVIIIDDELVITGSYNFSKNASKKNDENCIMIYSRKIAEQYIKEYSRIFNSGRIK